MDRRSDSRASSRGGCGRPCPRPPAAPLESRPPSSQFTPRGCFVENTFNNSTPGAVLLKVFSTRRPSGSSGGHPFFWEPEPMGSHQKNESSEGSRGGGPRKTRPSTSGCVHAACCPPDVPAAG